MAKIYLYSEDEIITNVVTTLIENNAETNGNITIEDITDDLLCYNWDADEEEFIAEHNGCTIYNVTQCVCGTWEQPIDILAVEY